MNPTEILTTSLANLGKPVTVTYAQGTVRTQTVTNLLVELDRELVDLKLIAGVEAMPIRTGDVFTTARAPGELVLMSIGKEPDKFRMVDIVDSNIWLGEFGVDDLSSEGFTRIRTRDGVVRGNGNSDRPINQEALEQTLEDEARRRRDAADAANPRLQAAESVMRELHDEIKELKEKLAVAGKHGDDGEKFVADFPSVVLDWKARAEAAEKQVAELTADRKVVTWADGLHEQCAEAERRAEAAEAELRGVKEATTAVLAEWEETCEELKELGGGYGLRQKTVEAAKAAVSYVSARTPQPPAAGQSEPAKVEAKAEGEKVRWFGSKKSEWRWLWKNGTIRPWCKRWYSNSVYENPNEALSDGDVYEVFDPSEIARLEAMTGEVGK